MMMTKILIVPVTVDVIQMVEVMMTKMLIVPVKMEVIQMVEVMMMIYHGLQEQAAVMKRKLSMVRFSFIVDVIFFLLFLYLT